MINVLAIDDEPLALQQLAVYISKIPFLHLVASCQSAVEARGFLNSDTVDAIFCDINMPDPNGMDFIGSLAAPPLVVFTTAYTEYAVEGYKVDAVDYLLKPFSLDEFRRAANKLQKRILLMRQASEGKVYNIAENHTSDNSNNTSIQSSHNEDSQIRNDNEDNDSLFVKSDGRILKIAIHDIIYVEGMSEYLKIHLATLDANGRRIKPVVILFSMKKLEERLPNYFMRIHRSFIINLLKIQEVNKNRVIIDNDTYLPIGDLYRETFNAYLNKNFLGK